MLRVQTGSLARARVWVETSPRRSYRGAGHSPARGCGLKPPPTGRRVQPMSLARARVWVETAGGACPRRSLGRHSPARGCGLNKATGSVVKAVSLARARVWVETSPRRSERWSGHSPARGRGLQQALRDAHACAGVWLKHAGDGGDPAISYAVTRLRSGLG